MTIFWKIVSFGALAVVIFDTLASVASKGLGFRYAYASIGSILIYTLVGYLIYRQGGLVRAVEAAVLVEIVDATLGWFISWKIGAATIPPERQTTSAIASTILVTLVFASICALIGSGFARVLNGPP